MKSFGESTTMNHTNTLRHTGHVTTDDRVRLLGQKAATLWLTGLSAAGKSTLAYALERELMVAGRACYVLDGDNVRHGLNRDLGFSANHSTCPLSLRCTKPLGENAFTNG